MKYEFIEILGNYRGELTRQQIRTLRGQALAGDVKGARKGLVKILERNKCQKRK